MTKGEDCSYATAYAAAARVGVSLMHLVLMVAAAGVLALELNLWLE